MEERKMVLESSETNLFENLWNKFVPFWPLFALVSFIFFTLAFIYALQLKPSYLVSATLVINNDERVSGYNESFRTLNAYASMQIVDNEVLVLHSRSLMKNVVINLHLYAPIFEKEAKANASAYLSSPILIEAKDPEKLQKAEKINFVFDKENSKVNIENKLYPLNEWITLPFATLRFIRNPRNNNSGNNSFYFSLVNPTVVADGLLNSLKVSTVSKLSTAININFQAETPQKGEDIVNELLKEYLRNSVANENLLATNTLRFVEERLREVEQDLDSIESGIEQFRSAEGVVDLTEQGRLYLQNAAETDRKIEDINSQLAVLDQVERYVNAQDSRTGIVPTTLGIDDPVLSQLLQRLNNLELQLANLRTTTGENNPLLTSIENEIQTIRPNIKSIVDNQQARLAASRNNLISTSNRFEKNIRNIPQQERELLEISRQQAVKRELYSFLLQRREEAALSNQSTIADNRIIDWAEASVASVSSKRILVLAASLIAAFALGILYVIFKEIFNSKILFRSEIEKLTSTPVVAEIIFEKYSSPIIFQNKLNTAVAEQFRQMHVSLGWLNGQDRPASKQKALITSSMPNEGKTFISVNFAASLALSGKKVLLVDLNLRSPQTTVLFNFGQAKSIKDFLQGTTGVQEIIHKTQYEHLDVIPAGARTNNSLELLVQNKLNDLFKVLEQYYDYIIIDAPPVELATDAYILSQYCDVTLFVIRHQITPKAIVQRMDDNTRLEQIQNLKIIFNGIKGRGIVKKFYGYGYGYGKEKVFKDNIYANTE